MCHNLILFQKSPLLIFCLIALTWAEDKQIKLEDIERDNLVAEKRNKQTTRPTLPSGNPHYETRPQQFIPSPQVPQSPAPPQYQQPQRQQIQYIPVQYQKPYQYVSPQQYVIANERYYPQPSYQIQYVTPPNYNPNQNFVFVQPVVAESTQIPKIAHQKGVQYVMFLEPNAGILKTPNLHANLGKDEAHTHNLAALLQRNAYTNTLPNNYRGPPPQTQQAQPTPHQTYSFQPPFYFAPQNQQVFQQQYVVPNFAFKPPQRNFETQQAQSSIASVAVVPKRQPTSLLDSYIPSVLQLQYYKQLQEAASNNVPQVVKFEGSKGGAGYVEGYPQER